MTTLLDMTKKKPAELSVEQQAAVEMVRRPGSRACP
jgi:hypothetical protein